MESSPSLYVADANIIIDLYFGKVLLEFFGLPYRIVAPDLVVAELQQPNGVALTRFGLESVSLSGVQVAQIAQLRLRYPSCSAQDVSALILARDSSATLLTGDGPTRRAALAEVVDCRGILWVLDELLHWMITDAAQAADALKRMLDRGARLPAAECDKRLKAWVGSGD